MIRKKLVVCVFLILPFFCNAQLMSSRRLLNNLAPFWELVEELRQNTEKNSGKKYQSVLMHTNNFFELKLIDNQKNVFLEVIYKQEFPYKLSLYRFYCADKKITPKLKNEVLKKVGKFEWESAFDVTFTLTEEQIEYLEIADRIASLGNDTNNQPSFYESVQITSDFIKLNQPNYLNSESIDHKNNFYLRDLYFKIPLHKKKATNERSLNPLENFYIGNMKIFFTDTSSKQNQNTGNLIKNQIRLEINQY